MVILRLPEEIERARKSNRIVAEVLNRLRDKVKPGVRTKELDRLAVEVAEKRGAQPAFKGLQRLSLRSLCVDKRSCRARYAFRKNT